MEKTERPVMTENKMGVMPVGRLLAGMAIPMMISMLAQAFYNIVDSIFVARISENALTAVSLAFPLQNLMIAVGVGTSVGMNTFVSRSLGAKKYNECNQGANTGIFLALCNFIVFALIGIFLSGPFYAAQTDVAEIIKYGTDYSSICLGLSIGIFCQFCFERLLQATGRTSITMCTQILGAIINIVLDPIFIFEKGEIVFGNFAMPFGFNMDVAGAAVATVIGQVVAACVALIANLKFNPEIKIRLKAIRWNTAIAKEIYRVGLPSIVMQSISSIMTFCMNLILISFSTTATAVLGSYFKLQSFVFMPIFGLNNGMVPIVSYNFGAKKADRVKRVVKLTIVTAVCIMTFGLIIFELFPSTLLSFFSPSQTMLDIGIPALRIIGSHFMLAGFCIIAGSVCQAIGNPLYSLIVSVSRQLLVLIPVAWLLAQTGVLKLVWLSFPIAEVVSLILSSIFLAKTMRSANRIMAEK
ncbi:MAG: MATE family efflux transporter [Ruminococcaceae bacterium]|nr:MATE family efflux transporter [Oscillospiraceae bacterium]